MWIGLLSSSVGYILPSPKAPSQLTNRNNNNNNNHNNGGTLTKEEHTPNEKEIKVKKKTTL